MHEVEHGCQLMYNVNFQDYRSHSISSNERTCFWL